MERTPEESSPPASRILAAAEEAFAEEGFAGARVDEIARRAAVNKAMLYYHVGGKGALYSRVLGVYFAALSAGLSEAVESGSDPAERLRRIQAVFARTAAEFPHFPQIMLRELASGGANLPQEALESMARFIATTRAAVEEGRASGLFRSDVDPLLTHVLVVGSVILAANGLRLLDRLAAVGVAAPKSTFELGEVSASASDIILHGILSTESRK